jgi:sortase A
LKKFALLLLMCSGGYLLADGGWIYLKAVLAQQLLEHAWQQTLETTQPSKPWPWADTRVLARLTVPAQGIEHIVLAGDSGRTLAFGPGHTPGSAMPGEAGSVVISGHRDTHFRFLEQLQQGNEIYLQTASGYYRYRVRNVRILNIHRHKLVSDPDSKLLYLVTCFPFDSVVSGGPLRYVVSAELIEV